MDITPFKDKIKEYLDSLAKDDKLFAKTYKKKNKNIEECVKYILQEVQKQAKGERAVGVADEEIYNLAVHYYDEDDIVVGKATPQVKVAHSNDKKVTAKKRTTKKAKAEDDEYVPLSLEIPLF